MNTFPPSTNTDANTVSFAQPLYVHTSQNALPSKVFWESSPHYGLHGTLMFHPSIQISTNFHNGLFFVSPHRW